MFSDFKRKEIKLTQINIPVGRDPKIWHTDVTISAFDEYLMDGNYSLTTKPIEKAFLDEVKAVEEDLNESFEDVLVKIKKLERVEHEGKQNDPDGKWKDTRNTYWTSTRTIYTETGKRSDVYYEIL